MWWRLSDENNVIVENVMNSSVVFPSVGLQAEDTVTS